MLVRTLNTWIRFVRGRWWMLGVLALGLVIRIVLLPAKGFPDDISAFESWALALGTSGPAGLYADVSGHRYPALDYPPGYLYVLWPIGLVYQHVCQCADRALLLKVVEKLPAVLADLGVSYVCYRIARDVAGEARARLVFAALVLLPPLWLVSAYWGQVDSVAALLLMLSILALLHRRYVLGWIAFSCTVLVKPQALPLVPILAAWELGTGGSPFVLGAGICAAALVAYVSTLPFTADHRLWSAASWLLQRYVVGVDKYPNNSTGGFTLYTVGGRFFESDATDVLGLPLHTWGIVLFALALAIVTVKFVSLVRARPYPARETLTAVFVTLAAFFVLSTRMHERYLMPALVVGAIVALFDRRYLLAEVTFAVTFTINCVYILMGFYGGGHHPITLALGHLFSAANVVAFLLAFTAFLRTKEIRAADRRVLSVATTG